MSSTTVTSICIYNEGISKVCMDINRQIVSAGHSSSVVFYDKSLDEDPYQFDINGGTIQDMVCYHRDNEYYVALATDKNAVLEYSYSSGNPNDHPFAESKLERNLLRFTAEVNCLDVTTNNKHLAAGASDFLIKVVDLDEIGNIIILEGHEAPVMCLQFCGNLLASSSCDGTVRIWSFKEKFQLTSVDVMPKANDLSLCATLCRLSWQPKQGNALAVPTGTNVKLYDRNSWTLTNTLEDDYHEMSINVCCWSYCGRYLAMGGADGHVTIWEYPSCKVINRIDSDIKLISSLFWDHLGFDSAHPLLFSSSTGHVGSIPGHMIQQGSDNITSKGSTVDYDDPMIEDSLLMEGIPADDIFDDDDDILNASCVENTKRKRSLSPDNEAPPTTKPRYGINDSDGELDNESADVCLPVEASKVIVTNQITDTVQAPPIPIQEYHEIFQPSATPTRLNHRFMAYNIIGTVCCHGDYEATPMIEVEFHNTLTHHSFSINNDVGWTMAALNEKGLVLATEKNEQGPSQFQVTVFGSWDLDKDWSYFMPKGESIDVVAIGNDWVAIATDKLFIRIYSLGGVQRELISSPGQFVTMNGCGGHLGVVYQETEVSPLSFWLLDTRTHKQVSPLHTLPLSQKAKLEWFGFSEFGLPISYDSKGIVRVLSSQYGRSLWMPVLDCHKALVVKGDHYFVVGMTHKPNFLRVILCKGLDYPPVHPRPLMTTLSLTLPLCDSETEKSEIECQYLQKQFIPPSFGGKPDTTELLQHLLEMIALACQSDHEYRGYELAGMIQHDQGLDLALQYASTSGHYKLAKHISSLIEQRRANQLYQDSDYDHDDTSNYGNSNYDDSKYVSQPIRRSEPSLVQADSSDRNFLIKRSSKFSKSESVYQNDGANRKSVDVSVDGDEETDVSPLEEEDDKEEIEEQTLDDQENTDLNSTNSINLFSSPQSSSLAKTNPFKIATPVSKQIQVERRSSFLDKLCKTVVEEEEEKRKKKERIAANKGEKKKTSSQRSSNKNKKLTGGNNSKLMTFAFNKKQV